MEEYFCFKIVFPSRVYLLSAESQDVMEQWMKALACASYDYIKLMASELQRQLNELGKPPGMLHPLPLKKAHFHPVSYDFKKILANCRTSK